MIEVREENRSILLIISHLYLYIYIKLATIFNTLVSDVIFLVLMELVMS